MKTLKRICEVGMQISAGIMVVSAVMLIYWSLTG